MGLKNMGNLLFPSYLNWFHDAFVAFNYLIELLSRITRFMYKCHHKDKWICCWVDCRIQEAKVERILIYIYTYECIGWLVDLFVETVLHLCSTRFQMPS